MKIDKTIISFIAIALTVLGVSWGGGSMLTGMNKDIEIAGKNASVGIAFKNAHNAIHRRHDRRMDRMEIMLEMTLRNLGVTPPKKIEE